MGHHEVTIALVTAICGAVVTIGTALIGYFTLAHKSSLETWEEKVTALKERVVELDAGFQNCQEKEEECVKSQTKLLVEVAQLTTRLEYLEKK